MATIEQVVVQRTQRSVVPGTGARAAYRLLWTAYVLAPLIAGIDKFAHLLVDWNIYASPAFAKIFGGSVDLMMQVVGAIEIAAAVLVAIRPRIGAPIVAVWLWGIIINLLLIPGYYDIVLRDFGLSLGALALWRLSGDFQYA